MTEPTFLVDKRGLAKLLERRGKAFIVAELIQNSWDEDVQEVKVDFQQADGRAQLEIEDDSPEGFADLSHAYTLFAESKKKGDAEKRGRFNLGEKLVVAIADETEIYTTKGYVRFDREGRTMARQRREKGTLVRVKLRMNQREADELRGLVRTLIPPRGITTYFNGSVLPRRPAPDGQCFATLPTEIADEDGYLKATSRRTSVEFYAVAEGEKAMLYEMGIPVVETGDGWHVNVCVAPGTRILTSDLRYVPAGEVKEGDALVGFDEERDGSRRRFRNSVVEAVNRIRLPSYRLTYEDGTEVISSADHQWLCLANGSGIEGKHTSRWIRTKDMVPPKGLRNGTRVVKPLDVWKQDNSFEAGYLSAAFDGEGSLTQGLNVNPVGVRNQLIFTQTENSMLESVRRCLEMRGIAFTETRREFEENANWKPVVNLHIGQRADMLRLLGETRPNRLLQKLDIDLLGTLPTIRAVRLVKKEYLGDQEVVAIRTSTHTFIAEGLASHNCQKVPLNSDRDNVTPSYLQKVRTLTVNHLADLIKPDDAAKPWVTAAIEDKNIQVEAVQQVIKTRFGDKVVINDLSDPEGTKMAVSQGYTVLSGGTFSRDGWANVRAAGILPAGQVTPSPKPYEENGRPENVVERSEWSQDMSDSVTFAIKLGHLLIEREVPVKIVREPTVDWAANCGPRAALTLNLSRLGHKWFANPGSEEQLALLLHEYAHDTVSDHLDRRFADEVARLGARLAHTVGPVTLDKRGSELMI